MDDILRRRLLGAAVLLGAALGLATLLPDPASPDAPSPAHVVTYDLRTGKPLDAPPAVKESARIPTPAPAATPTPTPAQPPVAAVASAPAQTTPPPAQPAPASPATTTSPGPLPHPTLKVDETFGKSAKTGGWYVQIGSFESQANARTVLQKLYGANLPTVIQTVPVGRKLWYRVRVGPYAAEGQAQTALAGIRQKGFSSAKLVRPESAPAAGRN